ncbi:MULTISPECIES: hypothetical protein [Helicobacter]|uniref:Uncharacterized protein n=1 Tax=Helicobacter bilis ATCC 43879 TaxID=613026 RepID=C3XH87_9HELI|nr:MULTISPECIES: hypothetical protein [Helicobacter]EEO24376.1 hypothetical protein HRAG_01433 [Helicobacter bilis ATCC 43879]
MKKMISVLVLGSILSFTALQAQVHANNAQNIIETHKVASISNDDMNMLFNDVKSGDVIALSNVEMSETKGESWAGALNAIMDLVYEVGDIFGYKWDILHSVRF